LPMPKSTTSGGGSIPRTTPRVDAKDARRALARIAKLAPGNPNLDPKILREHQPHAFDPPALTFDRTFIACLLENEFQRWNRVDRIVNVMVFRQGSQISTLSPHRRNRPGFRAPGGRPGESALELADVGAGLAALAVVRSADAMRSGSQALVAPGAGSSSSSRPGDTPALSSRTSWRMVERRLFAARAGGNQAAAAGGRHPGIARTSAGPAR
jgi:hypothetical protein